MTAVTLAILGGLAALALVEAGLALAVLRALLRKPEPLLADEDCPRAAIIVPLRGADPSLETCLQTLLRQDYPNYMLHLVLDSREDAAWPLVNALTETDHGRHLSVHVLEAIPSDASLKCAALAHVIARLDATVQAIVLVDADGVPASDWLRRLLTRLKTSGAAAVSGMRWFEPRGRSAAALLRYVWNAASIVQMYWHGVAWGGCLALDRKLFDGTDLAERLRHAYGEDTALDGVLRENNLRLVFDPTLIMTSREDTEPGPFLEWAVRQLVSVRQHHGGWYGILLFGLAQWLLVLAALALIGHGLWTGDAALAGIAGAALLCYELLQTALLVIGEAFIGHRIREEYHRRETPSWGQVLSLPLVILVTQLLHGAVLILAAFRKTVTWRGVRYRVSGKHGVRMLDYKPYTESGRENHSL